MLRVIKLGGSLLSAPRIVPRLRAWLSNQPLAANLLIVGGGEIVEAVRTLDHIHDFDRTKTHWLCIDLMESTATIASWLWPDAQLLSTEIEVNRWLSNNANVGAGQPSLAIVKPAAYRDALCEAALPQSWETTSDAIAACMAGQFGAEELVLLKSALPNCLRTCVLDLESMAQLAAQGVIDAAFPQMAKLVSHIRIDVP